MKSERGVTLSSTIIYIITMLIVVSLISVLTSYFYKNVDIDSENSLAIKQYTKFDSYFSEDINKKGNKVVEAENKTEEIDGNLYETNYITFSSGNTYVYSSKNRAIYYNNVKICTLVNKCTFNYEFKDSVYNITVEFETENFRKSGSNSLHYYIK